MPELLIGIDLGTTNSALAWVDGRRGLRIFDVLQLVAAGESGRRPTLPSFLYLTEPAQRDGGLVRLPWNAQPDAVAGVFARDEGALVPARQIASAKSWLSNAQVDRTAPLLPWDADAGRKLSPVEASARIFGHLRDAWNHERARENDAERLERQHVILTVPASFDEEARELTVQAAHDAGFTSLALLEEPLAALYAWIAAHRRELAGMFGAGSLILVCDVGGGTTDFSLIRTQIDESSGEPTFERILIGEHLLLGGDNLDLSLAVLVEQKLGESARLSLTQRQTLRRKCSAAKEQLLSDNPPDRVAITILGSGRGVVGGGMTADLTHDDVMRTLADGFLPITAPDDLPARDRRVGLRELGLPYETEPAITKHLAAFLTRGGRGENGVLAKPDAVLFNGGFFAPPIARERVLLALERWLGARPTALENDRPEAAVALGAAFYARLRRDPSASTRLIIKAGSARTYYVGVEDSRAGVQQDPGRAVALCVMPAGTDEGSTMDLDREFVVVTNQPAAFTLFSSTTRKDPLGEVVALAPGDDVTRHAPLVTAFRFGKRSRRVPLRVRLTVAFTETGTLELWCESTTTGHRWRLALALRGFQADPLDAVAGDTGAAEEHGVLIGDDALTRAIALIRSVFGSGDASVSPDTLGTELEAVLGHAKAAWPLGAIRTLADALLETASGRSRGAAVEARWLNLTGFCMRPGFGSASDSFRLGELRKVYMSGLAFPKEVQNQVEWIVLWQRVGAGFSVGQQRELAQRIGGGLGLGQGKRPRLNPQIERESWRLLASLERLDAAHRARLGDELIDRVKREPRNAAWLWAIGRFGARVPLYGPLNSVVGAAVAERWIEQLVELKEITADVAGAIVEIGARTGDHARDLSTTVVAKAVARLDAAGHAAASEQLQTAGASRARDASRVFGESLPEGLRID